MQGRRTDKNQLIVFQPALPHYRRDFFRRVSEDFPGQFQVLVTGPQDRLERSQLGFDAVFIGRELRLPFGLMWQTAVLSTPIQRGDVVVVSGNPRYLSSILLLLKARLKGARTIWWGHYWSATTRAARLTVRLWVMRLADAVLFYTDAEIEEFSRRRGKRDRRPISALNNGLNLAAIRFSRRRYIANERAMDALFVGRLTPKANLSLLITAMLDRRLRSLRLHVVGSGETAEALQAQATDAGLGERIVWHDAIVDDSKIGPIANRCRLFIYPGEVGLSLIHGMGYGLPCIVHSDRWRHMPEITAFETERTGRTFVPNDPQDLARVIAELINDEDLLDRCSARCVEITDKSFNTEDMARRFRALVERIQ